MAHAAPATRRQTTKAPIDENSLVDVSTSLTSGDPETGLSTLVRTAASLSNGPIGPTDAAS